MKQLPLALLFLVPNVNLSELPSQTPLLPPFPRLEALYSNVFFSLEALTVYCQGTLWGFFFFFFCELFKSLPASSCVYFFLFVFAKPQIYLWYLHVRSLQGFNSFFTMHAPELYARVVLPVPYAEITLPSYFPCLTRPVISLSFSTPMSSSLPPLLYWNLTMSYLSIMRSSFFPVIAFL